MSPVVEAMRDDDARRVEAQHLDISHRHRRARGSTIQTAGCRLNSVSAVAGMEDHWRRLQLDAAVDRRAKPHRRWRVRQADLDLKGSGDGVGLRRDLANPSGRLHGRIVCQRDRDARVARCLAQQLGGNVEHRVPPALARQGDDHLPCLHHLARLRPARGHGAGGVGRKYRIAHPAGRDLHLRLGGIDLGLRVLQRLLCQVELRAGRMALRQKRPLPLEGGLRVGELCAGSGEIGLRRPERAHFVLRVELGQLLPGFDPVADIDRPFDHPSGNAKGQRGLVIRLDVARQNDLLARFLFRDGNCPYGARFGHFGLAGGLAPGRADEHSSEETQCRRERGVRCHTLLQAGLSARRAWRLASVITI